jgi:hypothetical protein
MPRWLVSAVAIHSDATSGPSRPNGGELVTAAIGDRAGLAEIPDRRGRGGNACVGRVEQPGAQSGQDGPAVSRRTGEAGVHLGQVTAEHERHGAAAVPIGRRRAVTATEKSRQLLRSASSACRPAGVSS